MSLPAVNPWTVLWFVPAILLSLSPVSAKTLNIAWILMFLIAVGLAARLWLRRSQSADVSEPDRVAKTLLLFFLAGLVTKLGVQVYWAEVGKSLAFELNALTAAAMAWVISRARLQHVPRALVLTAMAVFAGLAVKLAWDYPGSDGTALPTGAVNWAAGVAAMLCLSLGLAFCFRPSAPHGVFAIVVTLALALALFLVARRGAYFALLWVLVVGLVSLFRASRHKLSRKQLLASVLGCLMIGAVLALVAPERIMQPFDRVIVGFKEGTRFFEAPPGATGPPQGSVGVRLHTYRFAMESIAAAPWLGASLEGKNRLVAQVESQVREPLFHFHSEYLDVLIAYGVPGLVASLCFPLGLVVAAWRVRRTEPRLSLMLTGLGLTHFFGGLTDVNTVRNYYQTLFAACVVLPFFWLPLIARRGLAPRPTGGESP